MSVQVENLEKNMAKLTIEVPAEEVTKAIQGAYQKNKNKFNVPGFRKGKVPQKMIEKMYGAGIFYEDAVNAMLPGAYEKACEESGLEIVSQPEIDVTQIEAGKPMIFTATVAVKPEVTLGQYKGLEVAKQEVIVTDDDVMDEIKKEQEKNAAVVTVEGRPVEKDDTAVIDFEGFCDGEAFEGGKGTDFPLVIGSGQFIPGFEDQLIGKNVGDEVEVNVTFPTPYQAKELEGKDAMFKVTIKELKTKELPEIDDEFASEVSEFDTLEEYKKEVADKLKERLEADAKRKKEDEAVNKAVENASMEIPEAMIKTQASNMVNEFAQRMQGQGLTMEQYMQFTGTTREQMMEQMMDQAKKRIQVRLTLEAVAKAEDIQVSDEELDKEVEEMAKAYQMEAEQLKKFLGDAEKEQMKTDLAVQKAVDLLVAEAKEV
ncbi:trigger factor [Fusibacillus kribbianus]|uniref:Trigger factor n=1 Tax=Fusibacillus kribbianus TaxID=3044208 RepID=A0AAP4B7R5_9FIRM|nr:trigger factor [Ruminococcus sp. YH-rum2234]MDI9241175.1 trigger factor [Ruminococcus sp. YH-rum2234]